MKFVLPIFKPRKLFQSSELFLILRGQVGFRYDLSKRLADQQLKHLL